MTYTGVVRPGGLYDGRELLHLTIHKVAVDPKMSNNCYLLRCTDTGDQVLIDAADDAPRLLELVGDGGLSAVVTTHQHWDHHRGLAEVVEATGATVIAGEPDADAITERKRSVAEPVASFANGVSLGVERFPALHHLQEIATEIAVAKLGRKLPEDTAERVLLQDAEVLGGDAVEATDAPGAVHRIEALVDAFENGFEVGCGGVPLDVLFG